MGDIDFMLDFKNFLTSEEKFLSCYYNTVSFLLFVFSPFRRSYKEVPLIGSYGFWSLTFFSVGYCTDVI